MCLDQEAPKWKQSGPRSVTAYAFSKHTPPSESRLENHADNGWLMACVTCAGGMIGTRSHPNRRCTRGGLPLQVHNSRAAFWRGEVKPVYQMHVFLCMNSTYARPTIIRGKWESTRVRRGRGANCVFGWLHASSLLAEKLRGCLVPRHSQLPQVRLATRIWQLFGSDFKYGSHRFSLL